MISEQERPEGGVLGNENDAIAIRNVRNIPERRDSCRDAWFQSYLTSDLIQEKGSRQISTSSNQTVLGLALS